MRADPQVCVVDVVDSSTVVSRLHSHNSDISSYRVHPARGKQIAVVAKSVRGNHGPESTQFLRREYEALLRIEERLGDSFAESVPHALFFLQGSTCTCRDRVCTSAHGPWLPTDGAIFTTLLEGVPFSQLLRRGANVLSGWSDLLTGKRLQHHSRRVGEWLRRFQERTAGSPRLHDHQSFMRFLGLRLDQYASGLSAAFVNELKQSAGELSGSFSGTLVDSAACHGDFLPQNILIAGEHVHILDFASFRNEAPVYTDVSHFLGYLLILSRKPAYSRSAVESAARHFLAGYDSKLQPGLLQLYVVRSVIRILLDNDASVPGTRSRAIEQLLSDLIHNHDLTWLE